MHKSIATEKQLVPSEPNHNDSVLREHSRLKSQQEINDVSNISSAHEPANHHSLEKPVTINNAIVPS